MQSSWTGMTCDYCNGKYTLQATSGTTLVSEICNTDGNKDNCAWYHGTPVDTAANSICSRCATDYVSDPFNTTTPATVTCAKAEGDLAGCVFKSSATACHTCHSGWNMGTVGKCTKFAKIASAFALIALFFANF
jgi:hypothetical protein